MSAADDAELIQSGLRAWTEGDVTALTSVLDPDVEFRSFGARQWDCVGRDQVLNALSEIRAQGRRPISTSLEQVDDDTFLLPVRVDAAMPCLRITSAHGLVIRIRQYPSRAAALQGDDPVETAAVDAIRDGDVNALTELLRQRPALASARLVNYGDRTLLHVATDWPGHFPNVKDIITTLIAAGADVNAASIGDHSETPLHWAASSNDVIALDTLLDAGANIEATGAVIGGGTALSDATAFGQWDAAHRLIERGAHPQVWEAAALGLMPQLQQYFGDGTDYQRDDVTNAFWCACHGNQPDAAAYLLPYGADINWIGYDGLTPLEAAQRSGATDLLIWLKAQGAVPAGQLN